MHLNFRNYDIKPGWWRPVAAGSTILLLLLLYGSATASEVCIHECRPAHAWQRLSDWDATWSPTRTSRPSQNVMAQKHLKSQKAFRRLSRGIYPQSLQHSWAENTQKGCIPGWWNWAALKGTQSTLCKICRRKLSISCEKASIELEIPFLSFRFTVRTPHLEIHLWSATPWIGQDSSKVSTSLFSDNWSSIELGRFSFSIFQKYGSFGNC